MDKAVTFGKPSTASLSMHPVFEYIEDAPRDGDGWKLCAHNNEVGYECKWYGDRLVTRRATVLHT